MFTTYVLFNENSGKIYIGQTSNIKERLLRHNGELKRSSRSYTYRNKGVWKLIYSQEFQTRAEAIQREKKLKSYQGRKFIKEKVLGP